MIAALYIDPRGPYPRMAAEQRHHEFAIDCWDEARDATKYDGPHRVVAHPPCGPWGKLAHLGHHHTYRDLALAAVQQVWKFGGVLEHPAGSRLWEAAGLPHLGFVADRLRGVDDSVFLDEHGGYTIEVDQVEWGHPARKRTWLYLVGVPISALETPPFPGRKPTHWCSGFREHSRRGQTGAAVPPGIKVCSAQQRRRTPPLFAGYLVRLARSDGSSLTVGSVPYSARREEIR